MIKLFQFPACWNLPNPSPFCMKLETYLRMTHLPFESVYVSDPRKSPSGKLPYIIDDGKKVTDTSLIIDYLKQKYGDTLDADLNKEQKAQALALQRLIEEHLYWVIVYSRWIDSMNWFSVKKLFFSKLPGVFRNIIANSIRKKIMRDLVGQGLGRLSLDEIYQTGVKDLAAMNILLGDKPYFMGDKPTSIDACGYGFLASIIVPPVPSPIQEYAKSQQNIVDYYARIKEKFYS